MTTPGRLCCRRPDMTLAGIDCAVALLNAGAARPPPTTRSLLPTPPPQRDFFWLLTACACVCVSMCLFDRYITHRLVAGLCRWDSALGSYIFYYAYNQSRAAAARKHRNHIRTPPDRTARRPFRPWRKFTTTFATAAGGRATRRRHR